MQKKLDVLVENIQQFEETIGYTFKDKRNIILALTHSSFANELKSKDIVSNERLEFLGDSVLSIVTSEFIYKNCTNQAEGEMTKLRASIVCEASLVICANKIELGKYLLLGKGEELTGGRTRTSILSDAFEAVIGAVYLDGGIISARKFINRHMSLLLNNSAKVSGFVDYKTQFQELVQKQGEKRISYEIVEQKGPDHNKIFVVQVRIGDNVMGKGEGKSKKAAEQSAAEAAIEQFGER
ncbi:MAG: ribonuclease III [Bacillota bacterium]|nr:ribonuclease III [Bacillota bacterium]